MSIEAQHWGLSGQVATMLAKGLDTFFLPLIEAEPFYQTLRIKLIFSGEREKLDGTTTINETFTGFIEETFSRAACPPPETAMLGEFATYDQETGGFAMTWLPDGYQLGSGFPSTAIEGEFHMALDLAGLIYDPISEVDLGVPPDPRQPRHLYVFGASETPAVVGERTTTPDGGSPTSVDIEVDLTGLQIRHAYSGSATEDWATNRIGHDQLRVTGFFGGAVIEIPTTSWTAAFWRNRIGTIVTGNWTDDSSGWDTSTVEIDIEIELS